MHFFLVTMTVGLAGLVLMAIPGARRHGPAGRLGGHARGHAPPGSTGHAAPGIKASAAGAGRTSTGFRLSHLFPEPRRVFSLLALFGAFGNLFDHLFPLPNWGIALSAAVPAVLLEWAVVSPLWRLALRFQGAPSSALGALVLEKARAVTAFRNGKGVVSVVRDGREVQFSARLVPDERQIPVKVGDTLTVQDVDPETERITVSH